MYNDTVLNLNPDQINSKKIFALICNINSAASLSNVQIFSFFSIRVLRNSIMYQRAVLQIQLVSGKSKETCHYVITSGMKIGNVQNAAKGTDVIIM